MKYEKPNYELIVLEDTIYTSPYLDVNESNKDIEDEDSIDIIK